MPRGPGLQELQLTRPERERLLEWTRRHKSSQALALRSRIVLGAAEGQTNREIAREQRVTAQTVGKWRRRFLQSRLDGLLDEPRPGAPRTISDAVVEQVMVLLGTVLCRPQTGRRGPTSFLLHGLRLGQ